MKADFIATIPAIQSALKTGGDGARVLFEVPESEMGQWAKLIMMRGEVLRVTVEVNESVKSGKSKVNY